MNRLSALLCILASQASANCADQATVRSGLSKQHFEIVQGGGVSGGAYFELWVNEDTGTWTFTRTIATGMMCIIAAVRDWEKGAGLTDLLNDDA